MIEFIGCLTEHQMAQLSEVLTKDGFEIYARGHVGTNTRGLPFRNLFKASFTWLNSIKLWEWRFKTRTSKIKRTLQRSNKKGLDQRV